MRKRLIRFGESFFQVSSILICVVCCVCVIIIIMSIIYYINTTCYVKDEHFFLRTVFVITLFKHPIRILKRL